MAKGIVKGVREPLPFVRLIISVITASMVFALLFTIAFYVSYINFQGVSDENNLIEGYLLDLDSYLDDIECDSDVLYEASVRLDRVGSRLAILENRLGKDNEGVLEQKIFYSELEVKHFEIVRTLNDKCDENFITILFIYSNDKEDDRDVRSETMGFILSAFKQEYSEKVMIYSFDTVLDSDSVRKLKETYGLYDAPITIVNEVDKSYIRSIDDLDKYL